MIVECGVAIIRKGSRVLIAQRRADDTLGSFWEFPGGKKEDAETLAACVEREVAEELGVRVAVGRAFMDVKKRYKGRTIHLNFFLCEHLAGEPRTLDCQRALWVEMGDLPNYKFPPANKPVIEQLLGRRPEGRH
ncbi:MAG: hypothetical protein A3D28_02505 [Omnitrophica bacterium RIFCSPHIGHO2_02_FULL_63_14]|nr:MAG: hypothetical protein A3D28_02505 [Omnitrophica bacterium RIFCSPHIGHO2_02_FULL_63_14]